MVPPKIAIDIRHPLAKNDTDTRGDSILGPTPSLSVSRASLDDSSSVSSNHENNLFSFLDALYTTPLQFKPTSSPSLISDSDEDAPRRMLHLSNIYA